MFIADGWNDFRVLDAGNGMKLERWKGLPSCGRSAGCLADGRAQGGRGLHPLRNRRRTLGRAAQLPESWQVTYRDLTFVVRPTGFKHTGLFPEQAVNWDWMRGELNVWKKTHDRAPKVLNLFAYTGGATVACAASGAEVVHCGRGEGHGRLGKGQRERKRTFGSPDSLYRGRLREIRQT
jgi:23S rRNA (cytosine1962-C5)-methyltransferase